MVPVCDQPGILFERCVLLVDAAPQDTATLVPVTVGRSFSEKSRMPPLLCATSAVVLQLPAPVFSSHLSAMTCVLPPDTTIEDRFCVLFWIRLPTIRLFPPVVQMPFALFESR